MLKRALLLLIACGCGATVMAQQFIYKWTDEQGMVQYSELPPPAGVKYEQVRKSSGALPGADATLSNQQAKERETLAQEEAKQKEQTEQAQKQADDARTKNCEIAKKNVLVLRGDTQVVKTDAKGNKVVLEAEQRAAELQKAQKDADYFCNL